MNFRRFEGRRGSVLLHVLVTSVLVSFIAASLMRMALMSYTVASRGAESLAAKRVDQAGFNVLMTGWNKNNSYCSAVVDQGGTAQYNCTGAAGTCGCVCTPTAAVPAGFPTITATPAGGNCAISIVSP